MFIENDALDVRRQAADAVLRAAIDAVDELKRQMNDGEKDSDRRAAAKALLDYAGLGAGVPVGADGVPRPSGIDSLLAQVAAREKLHLEYVDSYDDL